MVHYGIFTTMGDLIQSSDERMRNREFEELPKTLSSCSTVLYVSYQAGKTIFGTTLDVQKQQTREHTIVYLQESEWVGGKPKVIRLEDVRAFFVNATSTLKDLGYEILTEDGFTRYLSSSIPNFRGIIGNPAYSALSEYTAGNLLYHKPITCSTNKPENAFTFISDVIALYQYYLKFGCSFAITKFAVRDCDVSVLTDGDSAHTSLNLDTGDSVSSFEQTYYVRTWQTFSKPEAKRSISSQPSRVSLSSRIVEKMFSSLYVESGGQELISYHQFLVGEKIPVSNEVLRRFGLLPDEDGGKKRFSLRKSKPTPESVIPTPAETGLPRRKRPVSAQRVVSDTHADQVMDDSAESTLKSSPVAVTQSPVSEKSQRKKSKRAAKEEKPRKQKKQKPPKKPKVKKQKKQKKHGRKGKRKLKVILLILALLLIFVAAVAVLLVLIHQGYLPRVESFLFGVIDTIGNRTA